MRVVIDTNVLIAALRSPTSASAELLRRIRGGHVTMVASVPLFTEYEAVATRNEHLVAAGASRADIDAVLDALAGFVEPVEIHFLWRPRSNDPDDDKVLETAVNGGADVIVTFNVKDFATAAAQFGIDVVRPVDVLRRL